MEEQRKNIKKEGGTAVGCMPRHVTAATERREETLQNIRSRRTKAQSISDVPQLEKHSSFHEIGLTRRV